MQSRVLRFASLLFGFTLKWDVIALLTSLFSSLCADYVEVGIKTVYFLSFIDPSPLTGRAVRRSRHPEGSRTDGNVPSSHKKPAEREEPR